MWRELINTIIQRFNYEVGASELYIDPYMAEVDPFGRCYRPKIDCDSVAWCFEVPPNTYRYVRTELIRLFCRSDVMNDTHKNR